MYSRSSLSAYHTGNLANTHQSYYLYQLIVAYHMFTNEVNLGIYTSVTPQKELSIGPAISLSPNTHRKYELALQLSNAN